ncbi:MAG: pilus assembly protein [Actinomycetales bacterium]|nr:pilus assembly protein [Actinomycetales bacterium]
MRGDEGSALVEFLGVTLVLLVPVVYLVLVLGRVQAATFAVDAAAREAARVVVTSAGDRTGTGADERVAAAVGLALADQGLRDAPTAVDVACAGECLAPGTSVTVTVSVDVALPGVPGWLQEVVPLAVPVSATTTAEVDTYVAAR